MSKIFLRKKISSRIAAGHPWIYENETGDEEGLYQPGDLVSVFSSNGSFIGKGYINPKSKIKVRLLTEDADEIIDETFFFNRIRDAWTMRQKAGHSGNARIVYGEADQLAGLIIDKLGHFLVLQTLTLGMDLQKAEVVHALHALFPDHLIYERNDAGVRLLEGMTLEKGFLIGGGATSIQLKHTGLTLWTDIENGPRTGHYWEQFWIAEKLVSYVEGAEVLDVFCTTGCCGIVASKYGAAKVTGIDENEKFLELAAKNAGLNNVEKIFSFLQGNAFDLLRSLSAAKKEFDLIILDPPSLAKAKDQLPKALNGYHELHLRALKLLRANGFLFTCCSAYLITEDILCGIIQKAAADCGRRWRIIEKIDQAADHPVLWNLPSGNYFKGFIIQVY
jgi:23S rRNA (cytosine1962-C5)-methyltransferase